MDQVKNGNAISVDTGTMVTMSFERFMALKNVETDKERYATQISESTKNFAAADLRAKTAEDQLKPLQDQIEKAQESFKASEDEKQTLAAEWAEDISAIKQVVARYGFLEKTEEGWAFKADDQTAFGSKSVREKTKEASPKKADSTPKKSKK